MKNILVALIAVLTLGCGAEDVLDLAFDPPERKPINRSKVGVNNFFLEQETFGSIDAQFREIRDVLGIHFVRVLFAWTSGVQPTPGSSPNYAFYDDIVEAIPSGVDVVVVLAHTPDWMTVPANWANGNPRQTWVEEWVRPTVTRYAGAPGIIGWEIWNEPDVATTSSDGALDLTNAANYVELLRLSSQIVRSVDPTRLVVGAATRSIQQNFSSNLDYNRRMRDAGALDYLDIWTVHYYGEQYENVVRDGGVRSFLRSIGKPIWVTESGEQGPNNQLRYVETAWPFLDSEIPNIERFYYYQFASSLPLNDNYGMRTADPALPVSDLYVSLRDG